MKEKPGIIWYLVLVALLDFVGLGMVVAIFPHMMISDAASLFPDGWGHQEKVIMLGVFLAIYPLGQFFGASILGKMSDIYGRRRMMLMTIAGTAVAFAISGYAVVETSAVLLLFSRLLAGMMAGNVAIAQASMADISAPGNKTKNLSMIQTALGLAWVIGPPIGGWLTDFSLGQFNGYMTPFVIMAAIFILLFIYTLVAYPDTLEKHTQEKINVFSGLKQIAKAYSHTELRMAFTIWTVFVAGWWLFESFLPAYLLDIYSFSSFQIGSFLASMGATYALFQYFVVRHVAKVAKPENMVRYSLVVSSLAIMAISMINNVIYLHILITLFVTSMGFALTGLISSISNLAPENEQGEIMGSISSIQALATLIVMFLGGFLDTTDIRVTVVGGGLLLLISWLLFVVHLGLINRKMIR
ncbi:multidrug transporter [Xenorhabdus mauleonii]|uniref:Multidrug transporter n=1 Tax=Xenorhabdus mauleonii TaxID=351675 RepID=A0A1I3XUN5_9GAMM|nr:MFS transporter [Xenorhabdus mauleonii]PHM36277.1 multidrug transporter [Xenorhabdus mauleonii]SFK22771.1 Predicted arabinose efflux permease, MFS family [Xenorhabdus mauleonii]